MCQGFWLHRRASRTPQTAALELQAVPGISRPVEGLPAWAWRTAPRQPAARWAAWRQRRWRGPRRPCHNSVASPARGGGGAPGRPEGSGTPTGRESQPASGWSTDGSPAPRYPPDPWWFGQYPPETGCAPTCLWWLWWSHPSCHPVNRRKKKKSQPVGRNVQHVFPTWLLKLTLSINKRYTRIWFPEKWHEGVLLRMIQKPLNYDFFKSVAKIWSYLDLKWSRWCGCAG